MLLREIDLSADSPDPDEQGGAVGVDLGLGNDGIGYDQGGTFEGEEGGGGDEG